MTSPLSDRARMEAWKGNMFAWRLHTRALSSPRTQPRGSPSTLAPVDLATDWHSDCKLMRRRKVP